MNKAVSFLKKTLKVLLWVIGGYVLLLLMLAALIQIPAVQLKVSRYATSYISRKTHTVVELKKIHISFPKSVVVEGLYLEDLHKDTLFYARQVKVNVAFRDLFRHKVHIRSFAWEGVVLNVTRAVNDSLFNYNFLLTAFRDTTQQKITVPTQAPWTFSVDNLRMKNVRLRFEDDYGGAKPASRNAFDASHLVFRQMNLVATNFQYAADITEVSIKAFSAVDQKGFSITQFQTDFRMDSHSITANRLKVQTTNSSMEADLMLKYASLHSLMDSIPFLVVHAHMKQVSLATADILYFSPQLISQSFFKEGRNITTISGVVDGPVNHLTAKDLVIHTGVNTLLKTDFSIDGLPEVKTAYFTFPNLTISSSRKDMILMAGSFLPKSLELPDNFSMQIVFKGQIKSFESTLGMSSSYGSAHIVASIHKEDFRSNIALTRFDLGRLLKDREMYGPVSLTAQMNGHGLEVKTLRATLRAKVSQIYLNQYNYQKLNIAGKISGQEFEGKIHLDDKNAVFQFDGLVSMNPRRERGDFRFNLEGADLEKLHFTKDNLRVGLNAVADFKGGTINTLNGKVGLTNVLMVHDGNQYVLDSLTATVHNEPGKSELSVRSALVDVTYSGTVFPANLPGALTAFLNQYFPFSPSSVPLKKDEPQHFNFEIQLHKHPILTQVLLPSLKEFKPGIIQGSFDSERNELQLNATMKQIVYGTTELNDFVLAVHSDANALSYNISCSTVSTPQIKLDHFVVEGNAADHKIVANVSSIDSANNKKLFIRSQIVMDQSNYKITFDPKEFYLMNDRWDLAPDHYIEVGKPGFLIHHFFMDKTESQINIASVHDRFNDDLNIGIKNFKLEDVTRIVGKDTSLLKGTVGGNVLLKRVNNAYGIIADAQIKDLFVRDVPIGNLSVKAENPTADKFDIQVDLSGPDTHLTATGSYVPNGGAHSLKLNAAIQSLSMKTVQAFSMGQITEASGTLAGNFLVEGSTLAPEVTGELVFNNVFITPAVLNNRLELKHETIQLKNEGLYFNAFTLLDVNQHRATIDGSVQMKHFKEFLFSLRVNTQDFLLFNTTAKDNKEFYGRMIIDSRLEVSGPRALPVINATFKMKKGSNFTFAVPESKLSTDKGEEVVQFEDPLKRNPILNGAENTLVQKSGFTGFDLSSIIEIDKQATLRLLMDPASTDSLVVKGEAALSFTIDRSGKMSLTGAYNLNEGSYLVSLESLLKRKFTIEPGSTIIWNGDPLDAEISINAIYSVRASPIDLVADQMTGLNETDKNAYKQRYPFLVLLKLRGQILHPEISFEIQLAPEDKGILGGAVNAKLNMLNEDPSALNKQVFALLVLGRFIQENPFQSEAGGGVSTIARTTVGKFLSAQLNQWSSKLVPGVELNFDVQSYDDYQSGQAQGRTQVDIGAKKQLFNERLTVQLGGTVDVEGAKAKQNAASDITSDVTIEYKLTSDGRYRLKGFRHNQYEGAIEGQLVETGVGVLYMRDFNKWIELFKSSKTERRNTINYE